MSRLSAILCLPLCALALAACGASTSATSTSDFSGVKREVAQRIADFQSDASSTEERKICANDLAARIVRRLGGSKGCETAIKNQLGQVDNLEVGIQSVSVAAGGTSASATVKSIHEGKSRPSTLQLVKEGRSWKISGL
jgi:hypothetical protein